MVLTISIFYDAKLHQKCKYCGMLNNFCNGFSDSFEGFHPPPPPTTLLILCLSIKYVSLVVFVVCAGIGQGRVTNNVKGAPIDYAHLILDTEAVAMVRGALITTNVSTSSRSTSQCVL